MLAPGLGKLTVPLFLLLTQDGDRDIFIDGVVARNRALNGDLVVVKLLPEDQWKVSLNFLF